VTRPSFAPLGLVLALARCSTPSPAEDAGPVGDSGVCDPRGATVTLGMGTDASFANYRALADGDPVYLVPGPQGGQHIWVQLRGRGFNGTQPRIDLTALRAGDGHTLGRLRIRLPMGPAPDDPSQLGLSSQTLVLDDDLYCSVLPGDVVIRLRLDDGFGRCVTAERRVRVAGIDPMALEVDRTARTRCCTERLPRCYPDAGAAPGP
jgi:hypothetical protein